GNATLPSSTSRERGSWRRTTSPSAAEPCPCAASIRWARSSAACSRRGETLVSRTTGPCPTCPGNGSPAALAEVLRPVRHAGERGAPGQRRGRGLLLVSGEQGGAGRAPAREGDRRGHSHRAVRPRNRAPDGLDDAPAGGYRRRRARAAADRRLS